MRKILTGSILMIFTIIFCPSSLLFGASTTYYINDSTVTGGWAAGNDGNAGTSKAAPFATIEQALDNHGSTVPGTDIITIIVRDGATLAPDRMKFDNAGNKHDAYDFIIQSENGGNFTFVSDTDWESLCFSNVTSGSVSISNMTVSRDTIVYLIQYLPDKGMDLTLIDCNFSTPAGASFALYMQANTTGTPSRNVTLNNTFLSAANPVAEIFDGQDIVIENGSSLVNTDVAGIAIRHQGDISSLTISSSTITAGASGNGARAIDSWATATIGELKILNSTLTSGDEVIRIKDNVGKLLIYNSIITGGNQPDGCSAGLYLGEDLLANVGSAFGEVTILSNTISCANGSAIRLHYGINNANIGYNKTSGGGTAHSFVFYGSNLHIHHNICTGNLAMFESGNEIPKGTSGAAGGNHIHHNTVYSAVGKAFLTGLPSGASYAAWLCPTGSDVYNNIFVSNSSINYAFYDYEGCGGLLTRRGVNGDDKMSHFMDYNCYYNLADNTKAVKLGYNGIECDTPAEIQAVWATGESDGSPWNVMMYEINDQHSIVANPLFVDIANDDFRLRENSPCINAGMSAIGSIDSDYNSHTNMGAWQGVAIPPNCSDPIEADFNSDCKVDFKDLAIFLQSWLQCNLEPQETCWE
ncbi:MAG: hypothetical protein ABIG61_02080 [Planctomycetota bacterium]